jgi:hypothetical protein
LSGIESPDRLCDLRGLTVGKNAGGILRQQIRQHGVGHGCARRAPEIVHIGKFAAAIGAPVARDHGQ